MAKTNIDLIAGDCKALIDEVALKAQYAPHEEFRYAWEQLQYKLHSLLSAVYGSPHAAQRVQQATIATDEELDFLNR